MQFYSHQQIGRALTPRPLPRAPSSQSSSSWWPLQPSRWPPPPSWSWRGRPSWCRKLRPAHSGKNAQCYFKTQPGMKIIWSKSQTQIFWNGSASNAVTQQLFFSDCLFPFSFSDVMMTLWLLLSQAGATKSKPNITRKKDVCKEQECKSIYWGMKIRKPKLLKAQNYLLPNRKLGPLLDF